MERVRDQCDHIGRFIALLGNFSKPMATIIPTFLGNFRKGDKTIQFSSEIIFGQLLQTFGDFLLVTLFVNDTSQICLTIGSI